MMDPIIDAFGRSVNCVGSGPVICTASDGTEVSAPSVEQALASLNCMAPAGYVPPVVAQTTIAPLDFMARLTPAEQTAITTAGESSAQVMLFLLKLAGAQQVNVTDPLTIGGVNAMVTAGLLTQGRASQILDLSQASP